MREGRKEGRSQTKKPGAGSRSFVSGKGQQGARCCFHENESHFVSPSGSKPDCGGRSVCGRESGVGRRGEEGRGGGEEEGTEDGGGAGVELRAA